MWVIRTDSLFVDSVFFNQSNYLRDVVRDVVYSAL